MRLGLTSWVLISGALLTACGDVVFDEGNSGQGTTGSGGATAVGTSTTFTYSGLPESVTTGETAGVTTSSVTTGSGVGGASNVSAVASSAASSTEVTTGAGGGSVCGNETHELLTIVLSPPTPSMSSALGCSVARTPGQNSIDKELQGVLTKTSSTTFAIDTCGPSADCANSVWTLSLSAPNLSVPISEGAFVGIHMTETIQGLDGCADAIVVQNLASWDNVPNPVFASNFLWFAGADGSPTTVLGAPFSVSTQGLDCFAGAPNCGVPHDDYTLVFSMPGEPTVSVPMGETPNWNVTGTLNESIAVHNLRSFASGACDDPGQWGYWMIANLPD